MKLRKGPGFERLGGDDPEGRKVKSEGKIKKVTTNTVPQKLLKACYGFLVYLQRHIHFSAFK